MTVLYVEDTLVDLPKSFVFAQTIQKVPFGDLSVRKVNYTNSVKLPWTQTNRALFGFAFNEKSDTAVPYAKLQCRLVQNGIETIPDGYCFVNSADEKGVSITLFENVLNIFDAIAGLKLIDLNYVEPSAWDAAGIDSARTNTSNMISAVINWGKSGAIYQVNYFLPSFFYAEMVTEILERTGLTLSGDILADARFTDLIVPYGKSIWRYPDSFGQPYVFKVTKAADYLQVINNAAGPYRIRFDDDSSTGYFQGTAAIWDTTNYEAILPDIGAGTNKYASLQADLDFEFVIDTWNGGAGAQFDIRIVFDINGVLTYDSITIDTSYTAGATQNITLGPFNGVFAAADEIYVEFANGNRDGVQVTVQGGTVNTVFEVTAPTTPDRTSVIWNQLMPDILLTDVLRDFTNRFAIVYKQIGQTLYMTTLQDILTDTSGAIDWTTKRVKDKGDVISFASNNYGQSSVWRNVDRISDPAIGSGTITIPNETLEEEKVIFESVFGNAITALYSNGQKALIPVYGSTSTGIDTFENEPELRILTLRAKETAEASITFNAIARSDYKVGYYTDVAKTKDTGWAYWLAQFYAQLNTSLQSQKIITRYYLLNEMDIANYDPFKMIHDNGAYYLVNKIVDFVPGRKTKVELFKV